MWTRHQRPLGPVRQVRTSPHSTADARQSLWRALPVVRGFSRFNSLPCCSLRMPLHADVKFGIISCVKASRRARRKKSRVARGRASHAKRRLRPMRPRRQWQRRRRQRQRQWQWRKKALLCRHLCLALLPFPSALRLRCLRALSCCALHPCRPCRLHRLFSLPDRCRCPCHRALFLPTMMSPWMHALCLCRFCLR